MPLEFVAASEEHVEIGDVTPLNITGSAITLSCWVKIASTTAEKKIIAKWSDSGAAFSYLLTVGAAAFDKARFAIRPVGEGIAVVTGTTALVIGTWFHIAGTYDGTILRIYVNGVEEATTTPPVGGNIRSTTAPVRIGVGSGATSEQPTDGSIDDARIYDRVLNPDEILTIYNSRGRDGITLNLIARYLMNEGAPGDLASGAGVIKDSGPNGLDGTPVNTPTWSPSDLTFKRAVETTLV